MQLSRSDAPGRSAVRAPRPFAPPSPRLRAGSVASAKEVARATEGRRPPKLHRSEGGPPRRPRLFAVVVAALLAGCVAYERAEITIDPNPARATYVAGSPWEASYKANRAPRPPGGRWAEVRASSPGWRLGSRDRRRGRSAPLSASRTLRAGAGPVRLTLGSSAPTTWSTVTGEERRRGSATGPGHCGSSMAAPCWCGRGTSGPSSGRSRSSFLRGPPGVGSGPGTAPPVHCQDCDLRNRVSTAALEGPPALRAAPRRRLRAARRSSAPDSESGAITRPAACKFGAA